MLGRQNLSKRTKTIVNEMHLQPRSLENIALRSMGCGDHSNPWKILKEMGIPDHLTFLLRNLYVGQEAAVRTRCGKTDWFQIGRSTPRLYIVTLLI